MSDYVVRYGAMRFLGVFSAAAGRECRRHGEAARQLAQVRERHRVDRAEVIAHRTAIAERDARAARRELDHPGADGARVGHGVR